MRIVTLTLNPAFDVHCTCPVFLAGKETRADITSRDPGGKGVNISKALLACGVPSEALAVVGEENGAEFLSMLKAGGLDCVAVTVPGRIRENYTIHPSEGKETRLSFSGFRVPEDRDVLSEVAELIGDVGPGDIVTMTGSLPAGIPLGQVKELLKKYRAAGVRVVIDSGAFSVGDLIDCSPWLIKPNEEEIRKYMGREEIGTEDILGWAREMNRKGIGNVIVSLGKHGAILVCDGGEFLSCPPDIPVVSTIGAGDSSIGGFIWGAVLGAGPGDCLKRAMSCGNAACMTPGTEPPKRKDIIDSYDAVTLERLK